MTAGDRLTRLVLATAGAGLLVALLYLLRSEEPEPYPWTVFSGSPFVVGPAWIITGWLAWSRRPWSRIGLLLMVTGVVYLVGELTPARAPLVYSIAILTGGLYLQVAAQALITFPSGRLETRGVKVLVGAIWAVGLVSTVGVALIRDTAHMAPGLAENVFAVVHEPGVAEVVDRVTALSGVVVSVAFAVHLSRRWRRETPAGRRILAPAYVAGAVGGAFVLMREIGYSLDAVDAHPAVWRAADTVVFTFIPISFLVGLMRSRLGRVDIADLVVALGTSEGPARSTLRAELARRLGDPSLDLAYRMDDGNWVSSDGTTLGVDLQAVDDGRHVVLVEVEGEPSAALLHDVALDADPQLVEGAVSAARLAIANEHLRVSLQHRLEEVRASRRRLVEAGDDARRRVERDLHDGAQQRLVGSALALRLLEQRIDDPGVADELSGIAKELAAAVQELRELARGLHPGVLTDEGLAAAVESLAARSPVAVVLGDIAVERLPEEVEVTAYFVVAEALTNVAKHAPTSEVTVDLALSDGALTISVVDDGPGGAAATRGGGLAGLADRVAALDGSISIESPPGAGTRIDASIPIGRGAAIQG